MAKKAACCDKLSILYLSSLKYSALSVIYMVGLVVISFQFCILVHWNTVDVAEYLEAHPLW